MGDRTSIEWTEASWNPIRARKHGHKGELGWHCEILTPGCEHCYAQTLNRRLGTGLPYLKTSRREADVFLDEKILIQPLHWRRPRRIFVCSMTDLFGEWVADEMLDRTFAVMALCPQHTFQVLTKRADRMRDYLSANKQLQLFVIDRKNTQHTIMSFPLPNVWLGVSVEDQRRADERIPALLDTPAAVRWVSAEPLLEPITFRQCLYPVSDENGPNPIIDREALDWVVVGGESGVGARPFNIEWARSIIAQCRAAGVPCFVKQLGAKPEAETRVMGDHIYDLHLHDRKGGDPSEWPEDLRVREYPA